MEAKTGRDGCAQADKTTIQVTRKLLEQLKRKQEEFVTEARENHLAKTVTYNEIIEAYINFMDMMTKNDPNGSCYNIWRVVKEDQIKRNQCDNSCSA